ncbi:MAG: kinase/pyrophosphorylase [Pirellulaceae bacterium]
MQHDDSRRLDTIDQADIVLVGLSRVSKSPTSTFLGSLGYKTANVSFAPELGLPKELKQCAARIVGLTMQPKRLYEIRQRRFRLNRFATAFEERHESISYLDVRGNAKVMAAESMYRGGNSNDRRDSNDHRGSGDPRARQTRAAAIESRRK